VRNDSLRRATSAAGVARAETFSIEESVAGTERAYLRVLEKFFGHQVRRSP
jgi:hypothetical protein